MWGEGSAWLGLLEGGGGVFNGLCHGHDAVEASRAEEPGEGGPVAGDGHVAAELAGPSDPADQRAEAGGVDERHA